MKLGQHLGWNEVKVSWVGILVDDDLNLARRANGKRGVQ